MSGETSDLSSLVGESGAASSGLAHGEALLAFADAALDEDVEALARARHRLLAAVGVEALLDAAGVVGTFQQMDRIADATGIPLDPQLLLASQDVRDDLALEKFPSAANTPAIGALRRTAARLMVRLRPWIFARLAVSARRG